MRISKTFSILTVVSLILAVPVFSEKLTAAPANSASGKVEIVSSDDQTASAEFKANVGKAQQPANGFFRVSAEDKGTETYVDVVYVKVDGDYAWFAGKCTRDSEGLMGRWFFIVVHDGGKPGRLADHIWWDCLPDTDDAESIAKEKVENFEIPESNKPIKSGDIEVCFNNK